ncbi:hypothetical protein GCM10025879_17880 [Leuconostoc litchii]|nr:hypothetical protein GCM10025879_17880 [Leuconostoc litchii]
MDTFSEELVDDDEDDEVVSDDEISEDAEVVCAVSLEDDVLDKDDLLDELIFELSEELFTTLEVVVDLDVFDESLI